MTDRYCDLAQNFDNPANVGDTSGNPALGPGGFQSMIEGWGNHDALDAGDTLYLKGTADLSKLVNITVDVDKSGTWAISDVVENHNDGGGANGDDWVGELVYIDATTLWVQINAASTDYASVSTADGVYNVTQADEIAGANMTAKACPGIQIDNNQGDLTSGNIQFLGCDSSWTRTKTDQAVLDGDSAATNTMITGSSLNYFRFENIDYINATGYGMCIGNSTRDFVFRRCRFMDNGSDGIYVETGPEMFIECVYSGNSGFGIYKGYSGQFFCRAVDNGSRGMYQATGTLFGCLVHNNHFDGIETSSGHCIHCVLDGNGGYGLGLGSSNKYFGVIGNRICNNSKYGLRHSIQYLLGFEDYNVFYNNNGGGTGLNVSSEILKGEHSYGTNHTLGAPGDDGYVAAGDDFNVVDGKEIDSVAIDLNWDS